MKKKRKYTKRKLVKPMEGTDKMLIQGTELKHLDKMTLRENRDWWHSRFQEEHDQRQLQDQELRVLRHDLDVANQRLCRYERIIDWLTGVRR